MKFFASVVIVHWNTPTQLKSLVSKLKTRSNNDFEIIVVDNNSHSSSDKTLHYINQMKQGNIKLIRNKTNAGYAKACNQGARKAKGEWLVFLNPDVAITSRELLKLIDQASEKQFDAFSVKLERDYQKPLPSGLSLLAEFTPLKYVLPLSIFPKKTLAGGLLFIKRKVFEKLGGWDERFFLWFEDSDLTRRLYDVGYRIGWLKANMIHVGGESFKKLPEKKRKELFFSSMRKYSKKHFGLWGKLVAKMLYWRYLH